MQTQYWSQLALKWQIQHQVSHKQYNISNAAWGKSHQTFKKKVGGFGSIPYTFKRDNIHNTLTKLCVADTVIPAAKKANWIAFVFTPCCLRFSQVSLNGLDRGAVGVVNQQNT